ncbi:MAG: ATP-dependent metallopeptidase FtsH/Yme1/Tma family protein [Peptococcaceae bacterium]|nr:ATP-dependent metallopeptidase FtsH/Yme1/Tma family protein [Peptococcaceae bacterium]
MRTVAIYMVIVLLAMTFVRLGEPVEQQDVKVADITNYTQLMEDVEAGKVASVEITTYENTQTVNGELTDGSVFNGVIIPRENAEEILTIMQENLVVIDQKETPQPSPWISLLGTLLPLILMVGLFFFIMQQSQGGGGKVMQFSKSKAKVTIDEKNKVTFNDVAGADEVKEELQEIVEFLKAPKKFNEIGAKIPKGVLLYGPPGTGKTLLARAVAGEAGVAFFSISGSDFVEMFVGVGASRVRDLFDQAKKNAPCIIFIDEIDAVGRQRGAGVGGGHDEREQTLNQLLVEMDGFNSNEGIIILAATNRPDILDPALLRPGRFDRQVTVDRPDVKGREEILKVHVRKTPLASDVDLAVIAKQTAGFTGADLANLVNEAALLAARLGLKKVGQLQLEQSIERVIAGPEKKSRAAMSEYEKNLVSYHEAGHALCGYLLPECDPVHKVSIIPRGRAGGYTLLLPTEDRNYMTRTHLRQQIVMMLGGRVAEEIVLHEISTGASNDIERATGTIRRMITEWGMSDELGTITFGNNNGDQVFLGRDLGRDRNYSEAVAYSIDKEVKRMMDDCHAEATRLLTENLDKLTLIAETLKEREVIQADEFIALMEGRSLDELDRQKEEVLQEQKGVEKMDAEAEHNEAAAEETPAQEEIMQAETAAEDVTAAPVMEADDAEQKSTKLVTEKQDEVK